MFEGVDEPVDVLITLAGKDSEEHIEGTMQVANLIEFDEDFSKLRACKSPEVARLIDAAFNTSSGSCVKEVTMSKYSQ